MKSISVTTENIIKVSGTESTETNDTLAVEEPLEISMSIPSAKPPLIGKNISITMRTPGNDAELALGFLFTEGIITAPDEVFMVDHHGNTADVILKNNTSADLTKLERHFYTSSSCGVCGKASIDSVRTVRRLDPQQTDFKVPAKLLQTLPARLREEQAVFESTGGLHAAALFNLEGKLLELREDVGRHNALDKLIGAAFQEDRLPLNKHLLLLSGRASFELIQKAAMAGISFVMAVGAPSSLAVELAGEFNMTLIGFLSGERFNIYQGANRIEL
ncbi:formate dehydrogenase accessory sulfurtransferase FdhD [Leptobacterium flavescens]|uniref:Sulfur carrier protein FdhD n=1 Tax=Leptobacterium flavescens TaxID=472055 RepID=A0A6P0UKD3_9FLAO|nr:formate dehydrogenase accessory sulfurtransferase FdhD [Leptobacterium flavescens]NER12870.1 formate dehydrogenase accessory sulfurtransferase FdhD [Leptobacterium flavescens]